MDKETKYPRIILGLDVSTTCIGACIIKDDGESDVPEILKLTHVSPKISGKIKGIEALFLRKKAFEESFMDIIENIKITDAIIEEPLMSSNNTFTVAALLRYNGMISELIYDKLGIVPNFISSYDARMYSFPELVALRKYNKKGQEYPLKHIQSAIKKDSIVLFGSYPFDIDKKVVMMNAVNDMYKGIKWIYDEKKGVLKKENYDACDSLVCALAYVNINHHGIEKPTIISSEIEENENGETIVRYTTKIWNREYKKILTLGNKPSTI